MVNGNDQENEIIRPDEKFSVLKNDGWKGTSNLCPWRILGNRTWACSTNSGILYLGGLSWSLKEILRPKKV